MTVLQRVRFVGLQEEFRVSALLLARLLNVSSPAMSAYIETLPRERRGGEIYDSNRGNFTSTASPGEVSSDQRSLHQQQAQEQRVERERLLSDKQLMRRVEDLNHFDVLLYQHGNC